MKDTASYGRRAASYWFVDGFPELLFGLNLLVFTALGLLFRTYAPARWMPNGAQVQADAFVFLVGLLIYYSTERRILEALKSRFTYPRTGYVNPPEEQERQIRTLTVLTLKPVHKENVTHFRLRTVWPIYIFVLLFWLNGNPLGRWLAPSVMPVMAITLYLVNRKLERPYSGRAALMLGLAGPLLFPINIPAFYQPPLPILLVGIWLAAQGASTLLHYVHENPYPLGAEVARPCL